MTRRVWLLLAATLALAAELRFADLAGPSLWDDEMHSIVFAQRPVATMAAQSGAKDSNPLGFYLLLHGWVRLSDGDGWTRALSAALGLAAVAAAFGLGRTLYGARAGLLTALLAAAHPLSVYCSREIRPHAAAELAATLAIWFFARLLATARKRDAAGLALTLAAALHLHYYVFFVLGAVVAMTAACALASWRSARRSIGPLARLWMMAAVQQNAATMLYGNALAAGATDAWRTRGRALLLATAACAAAIALFLPFFRTFALQLLRGQPWRPELSPASALVKTWLYFAFAATPDRLPDFGWRADGAPSAARLVVFLGAASLPMLVALALGWRDAERRAARNLLLWLSGVSLALLAGALLAQPLFDPRHALLLMPPALALAARGLDRGFERSRALGAALLLAVLAPMLLALQQERVDPRYARQDWRGAAQAVCRDRRPGDAAFAFHEEKAYSFAHYASACDLRVDPLFDDEVLAMDLDKRRDHLRRRLANLTAGAVRLWLIDYHGAIYDPAGDAWRELSALGYRHIRRTAYDRGVKRFAIDLFTRDQAEARAADAAAVDFAGAFNPSQLLDGWRPPGDQGAWIGPRAAVRLARSSETAIEATAYVHRPFYRGPVTVRLLVGNEPVAAKTTNEAALLRICGPLPASALAGDSVEAAITVDPTFVPADVLPTQDREPKGALVQRIGLGLTAPPDCP